MHTRIERVIPGRANHDRAVLVALELGCSIMVEGMVKVTTMSVLFSTNSDGNGQGGLLIPACGPVVPARKLCAYLVDGRPSPSLSLHCDGSRTRTPA